MGRTEGERGGERGRRREPKKERQEWDETLADSPSQAVYLCRREGGEERKMLSVTDYGQIKYTVRITTGASCTGNSTA